MSAFARLRYKHSIVDLKTSSMKMSKMPVEGNSYFNVSRRTFIPHPVPCGAPTDAMNFAYAMCFGAGHHRAHRTGGLMMRRAGEMFSNAFQGKLAEVCLHLFLTRRGVECTVPDFGVYGEGVWDGGDLKACGKNLSVKSAAFFSNLLLLESRDYDAFGNYLPNVGKGIPATFDYCVLVRISPDAKGLFRRYGLFASNDVSKDFLAGIVSREQWTYDIAGFVSREQFVSALRAGNVIPQGALLNGRMRMDADNYYIQAGDMHSADELAGVLMKH